MAGIKAEFDAPESSLLGFDWDEEAHTWRPKSSKFWKISHALRHVLRGRKLITGKEVGHLIGHLSSLFLLRRELLSIFFNVYDFINASWSRRQPLWPSVRRELQWSLALLPFAIARCDLPWAG